jgi:digeranylgeranylglycerophospholipid reductase
MRTYDLAVIGGGPAGTYTAYRMADLGFEVALFEKDKTVGSNIVCTGIVGAEAFRKHDLPMDSVLYKMDSVTFFSPSGETLDYAAPDPFAYVIDRGVFDGGIFQRAIDKGVVGHVGRKVTRVTVEHDCCRIQTGAPGFTEETRARAIVLATGVNYDLHGSLGLGRPPAFLFALQTVVSIPDLDTPEVYLNDLPHGSFAWAVPAGGGRARVGALTRNQEVRDLVRFVRARVAATGNQADPVIACKPIAHGLLSRTAADRVIAVGEAAGQIKTTTGGGIFYGLMCSDVAVDVLSQAFCRGDLSAAALHAYEKGWRSRIGKEIQTGCEVRRLIQDLDPARIDYLFRLIGRSKPLRELVRRKVNFDHQADLLLLGIKLASPFLRKAKSSCSAHVMAA